MLYHLFALIVRPLQDLTEKDLCLLKITNGRYMKQNNGILIITHLGKLSICVYIKRIHEEPGHEENTNTKQDNCQVREYRRVDWADIPTHRLY